MVNSLDDAAVVFRATREWRQRIVSPYGANWTATDCNSFTDRSRPIVRFDKTKPDSR